MILEPLHRAFGGIAVRSAHRSPTVNGFCHKRHTRGDAYCYCSDNVYGAGRHVWDLRDAQGYMGATASVVVPWYIERFEKSGDFRPLAWWIRDHIEHYAEAIFFPWLCAFDIRWYEGPSEQAIYSSTPDELESVPFAKQGMPGFAGDHANEYSGFPRLD